MFASQTLFKLQKQYFPVDYKIVFFAFVKNYGIRRWNKVVQKWASKKSLYSHSIII